MRRRYLPQAEKRFHTPYSHSRFLVVHGNAYDDTRHSTLIRFLKQRLGRRLIPPKWARLVGDGNPYRLA